MPLPPRETLAAIHRCLNTPDGQVLLADLRAALATSVLDLARTTTGALDPTLVVYRAAQRDLLAKYEGLADEATYRRLVVSLAPPAASQEAA